MQSAASISITTRHGESLTVDLITNLPSLEHAILSASEGFGQPIDQALSLDVEQHLEACHFGFQFLDHKGEIAGFTLFKSYGDLLCGGGMMIRPRFQRSGLVGQGIRLAQARTGAQFLAFRTQSPRMWSAARKLTRIHSPTPHLGFYHPELAQARRRAADVIGVELNVTRAVFDRPLYGRKPTHLDPAIQTWWDTICDFDKGDMVLFVGAF